MAGRPSTEKDLKRVVGSRIRDFRRERKVSQQQLAEQADRSVDTISALERGLALPSLETLAKVAEALGVELGELFGGSDINGGGERRAQLEKLATLGRRLSNEDLAVAVEQIAVLARRSAGLG